MSDGPTLRPEEDAICVVDVSNEGAGGLWWSRAAGRCRYFHRRLPAAQYGATSRDSCRAELVNLVAAARLWAADWTGRRVLLRCDHPCVRRGASESRRLMEAALAELGRRHGFHYRLEWSIRRQDPLMEAADLLSRVDKPRRAAPLERGLSALAAALGPGVSLEQQTAPADHLYGLSADVETSPSPERPPSVAGGTSPATEQSSAAAERSSPAAEPSLPAEEPSPVVEDPSLLIEEPSPVVEEASVASEEPSPVVEESSLLAEEPSPVVEEASVASEEDSVATEEPKTPGGETPK